MRLLTAVRSARPELIVTLDPGHVWCADPTPDILGLIGLADYLILNQAEFDLLAGRRGSAVVLVKTPTGIRIHRAGAVREVMHKPLAPDEIVDSTGAGDVFAAGLLALLVAGSPGPHVVEKGAQLGLSLARHKLRHRGTDGHAGFGALAP